MLKNKGNFYSKEKVFKKNGIDFREIYRPKADLKLLLKKVNKKYLSGFNFPSFVHCGPAKKSIVTAAKGHEKFNHHISLDIIAFFDRVTKDTVEKTLRERGVKKNVIKTLTDLVVEDNRLPQGFPTSPLLSAMVISCALKSFCNMFPRENILLSVYADDLLLSSEDLKLLKSAEEYIKEKLSLLGLVLNDSKKIAGKKGSRFTWLGLQIHPWINLPRKNLQDLQKKAHLYRTKKIIPNDFKRDKNKKTKTKTQWKESMRGKITFARYINGNNKLIKKTERLLGN